MGAFFAILIVPLLGVLLYVAATYGVSARTPGGRFMARGAVLVIGVTLILAGCFVLAMFALQVASGVVVDSLVTTILLMLAEVALGLLLLWAGRAAVRVFRLSGPSARKADPFDRERATAELQLAAALQVLAPLLLLGVFGIAVVVPVMLWGIAFWAARRAQQAQFLWTMALAVRNELPLADEVDEFAQPLWAKQRRAYHNLASRLRDGQSLGEALEKSPGIVSRPIAGELRMAEDAGTLPEVLAHMATQSTSALAQGRNDTSLAITLIYVWALLAMFVLIASFILYWIIPKFKDIFNDFGIELPPLTISLVKAADFSTNYFVFVLPLVGMPIIFALIVAAVYFVEWGNLNVPLLMRWFPRRDAPSLLRSLSHAVGAQQALPEVVGEMSHRHLRSDMRLRLSRISGALEQGEPLWVPLKSEGFIRPAEADALAAAQRSNNLPWAMRTLADSIDRTAVHRTQFWMELVKPAVVVSVGLIVAWFVIAMFLPLVKLINQLA